MRLILRRVLYPVVVLIFRCFVWVARIYPRSRESARVAANHAHSANLRGEFELGEAMARVALAADSTYANAWRIWGEAFQGLNQWEKAEGVYRRALEAVDLGERPALLIDLANCALRDERLAEAEDLVRQAIAIDPDDTRLRDRLARVRTGRGR